MTTVWAGITLASVYILVGIGYNLVFASSGVFNFAQAQMVMIGTFVAYWTSVSLSLPIYAGFLIGAAIGFIVGFIAERISIRPVLGKTGHAALITTLGVAVILDGIALAIWGPNALPIGYFSSPNYLTFLGARISPSQIGLFAAALLLPLAVGMWHRYTRAGLANIAVAANREAAMLRGINVRNVSVLAMATAGAIAGVVGPLVGAQTYAVYTLGDTLAVTTFVALAIGGFGSNLGVVIGGLIVGITQAESERYLSSQYADLLLFGILLAVLFIRPSGIFGQKPERAV